MAPARKIARKKRGPKRVKRPLPPPEVLHPYREPADADRRPVDYTFDLSEVICDRLANGESTTSLCRDPEMPTWSVLHRWVRLKVEFGKRFRAARECGYEYWADDTLDIADTPQPGEVSTTQEWGTSVRTGDMLEHRRLRIDARKWLLCKRARHIYGEKADLAPTTPDGLSAQVEERNALIEAIVKMVSPKKDGETKPAGRTGEDRKR